MNENTPNPENRRDAVALNLETYRKIARQWHEDHRVHDWWKDGTDTLISMLPKGGTVLDIGCAGGHKSKYFLERGFAVTGVDLVPEFIDIIKEEGLNMDAYVADMRDLSHVPGPRGHEKEQYDCVFANASLLHIEKQDVPRTLSGFSQKLKPGGLLYIAVKRMRDDVGEAIEKEDDVGFEYERFFSYYTRDEMTGFLNAAGFSIEDVKDQPHGTNWLQVIARKQ